MLPNNHIPPSQTASSNTTANTITTTLTLPPPIVYGELSILGYNGYIPSVEKNGSRNKSKYLLCKRPEPNGIKKSRHYIVKQQPQAIKAIQDKEHYSISYTFSRSQTIIVEYRQDENTDMFQIGRSTEDPIDFVVMDTLSVNNSIELSSTSNNNNNSNSNFYKHQNSQNQDHHHHHHHHHHHQHQSANAVAVSSSSGRHNHCENNNASQQQFVGNSDVQRFQRHLAKVSEEMLQHYGALPPAHDSRGRPHHHSGNRQHQNQAILLNYPHPNISNLPPMMADHFRIQDPSVFLHSHHSYHNHQHNHNSNHAHSSNNQQQSLSRNVAHNQPITTNNSGDGIRNQHDVPSRHNPLGKRPHATQSTISRFACRILVDRNPPYTARIFAAGFDSSKNIFLGEKATKWEQENSFDGLTTNGVLLMHPKKGGPHFYEDSNEAEKTSHNELEVLDSDKKVNPGDNSASKQNCPGGELDENELNISNSNHNSTNNNSEQTGKNTSTNNNTTSDMAQAENLSKQKPSSSYKDNYVVLKDNKQAFNEIGGLWREVSVDGGIYAIRESRSATKKGTRIEEESNILKDGTLIDLCGATLLWRSVEGFKASPTKKSLEEKIDMLNGRRPQCPVGLNTLVIPRKPILPSNSNRAHKEQHNNKDNDKNSHQPYVYLKCGHVQGYHDWGATDKSNQRTCPICLSVGTVAKLSMGLEPSFYVDSGPLTHVFSPCGHMASEKTVRYWCAIKIPHGPHSFHSICPFCATPLAINEPASTKLIFQDDLD